ncbi:MAG TPA: hypothetical protein VFM55_18785 [Micromonosporaceae bacterium]|nr:hypothetical protein [Micromonosporaceae bacterium]
MTELPPPALAESGRLVDATRTKLVELGREDDPNGALALLLAADLDAGTTAGTGKASIARAYLQAMDAATKGVTGASSALDELRKRRERRRGA